MKTSIQILFIVFLSIVFRSKTIKGEKEDEIDCFEHPLDIIFIIDGSNSVSPENFNKVKEYIVRLVKLHDIGIEKTQIGVIQYGSLVKEEIKLGEYQTKEEIIYAVQSIKHMQKGSMAGEALKYMVETSLSERDPIRVSNPTLLTKSIMITDGASQDYSRGTMTHYQEMAKKLGVEMYAIGVGVKDEKGIKELEEIASEPNEEHIFMVQNYAAIEQLNEFWHETKVCVENECASGNNNCSHLCINTFKSYQCQCFEGYKLDANGFDCHDIDECKEMTHECSQNCINEIGSYRCECNEGYEIAVDNRSCEDVNECLLSPKCNQTCQNTEGSYTCGCEYGYILSPDGFNCEDIDECGMENNCSHICKNVDGSYFCECEVGYALSADGFTCEAKNECITGISNCDHICVDTEESYKCECKEGFILQNDGYSCKDIDECVRFNGNCSQICVNLDGRHECECTPGYRLARDLQSCMDIDECQRRDNVCDHLCLNVPGSYECYCKLGYVKNQDGHSCEDVDECASELSNSCTFECVNTEGSYYCGCDEGFKLSEDQVSCIDVDECTEGETACDYKCTNTLGSYQCSCPDGYYLSHDGFHCTDTDECLSENGGCSHFCNNTDGSYFCSCPLGFQLSLDNHTCIDIDECADDKMNMCSQECENIDYSYKCYCFPGYSIHEDGFTCIMTTIEIRVTNETTTTISVEWTKSSSEGLTSYLLNICKASTEQKFDEVGESEVMKNTTVVSETKLPSLLNAPDCVLDYFECLEYEYDSNTNKVTVENLTPNTKYKFTVVPVYKSYKGNLAFEFGTTKKLVPILTNLTFENQEHNKTVFKWSIENYNESYERIDHFTVIYYYNVIGYATTVMTNVTKLVAMNIIPNKEYIVQITGLTTDSRKTNALKGSYTFFAHENIEESCSCKMYRKSQMEMENMIGLLKTQVEQLAQKMELAYKHIDGLELKVNKKNRRKNKNRNREKKRKNKNGSK